MNVTGKCESRSQSGPALFAKDGVAKTRAATGDACRSPVRRRVNYPDFALCGFGQTALPRYASKANAIQFKAIPVDPEILAPKFLQPLSVLEPGILSGHAVMIARADCQRRFNRLQVDHDPFQLPFRGAVGV